MKKLWIYSASTPIQRVGIISLLIGLALYISWGISKGYDLIEYFDPYYFPSSSDSIFYLSLYLIPFGLIFSVGYPFLLHVKYWILNGKLKPSSAHESSGKIKAPLKHKIHFKNNLLAFKFAVDIYTPSFENQKLSFGLIQKKILLNDQSVQFLVQLADTTKTTFVCGFNDKYGHEIQEGNLVYWGFVESVQAVPPEHMEAIGHIVAILNPEFDPNLSKWSVRKNLTK
jgi:hypothetical protein